MRQTIEGLKIARLLMVVSSFSPLFILWAIRGNCLFPDNIFITACIIMAILPNIFLLVRIRIAIKNNDKNEIVIDTAEDHRDDILVYLFAMMLPFYSEDMNSMRNFVVTLVALAFIIFIFWHLNLHYMNIIFACLGYRIFTVFSPVNNHLNGRKSHVIITHRECLLPGEQLIGYRISNTVYLEVEK